eukprot:Rhum_TRINITY_DN14643_c8_g1::Rhum_TRINITY_DN14643_c8_g1_i1::g.107415::m.107415
MLPRTAVTQMVKVAVISHFVILCETSHRKVHRATGLFFPQPGSDGAAPRVVFQPLGHRPRLEFCEKVGRHSLVPECEHRHPDRRAVVARRQVVWEEIEGRVYCAFYVLLPRVLRHVLVETDVAGVLPLLLIHHRGVGVVVVRDRNLFELPGGWVEHRVDENVQRRCLHQKEEGDVRGVRFDAVLLVVDDLNALSVRHDGPSRLRSRDPVLDDFEHEMLLYDAVLLVPPAEHRRAFVADPEVAGAHEPEQSLEARVDGPVAVRAVRTRLLRAARLREVLLPTRACHHLPVADARRCLVEDDDVLHLTPEDRNKTEVVNQPSVAEGPPRRRRRLLGAVGTVAHRRPCRGRQRRLCLAALLLQRRLPHSRARARQGRRRLQAAGRWVDVRGCEEGQHLEGVHDDTDVEEGGEAYRLLQRVRDGGVVEHGPPQHRAVAAAQSDAARRRAAALLRQAVVFVVRLEHGVVPQRFHQSAEGREVLLEDAVLRGPQLPEQRCQRTISVLRRHLLLAGHLRERLRHPARQRRRLEHRVLHRRGKNGHHLGGCNQHRVEDEERLAVVLLHEVVVGEVVVAFQCVVQRRLVPRHVPLALDAERVQKPLGNLLRPSSRIRTALENV